MVGSTKWSINRKYKRFKDTVTLLQKVITESLCLTRIPVPYMEYVKDIKSITDRGLFIFRRLCMNK